MSWSTSASTFDHAWRDLLETLVITMASAPEESPRGKPIYELLNVQLTVADAQHVLLASPARYLAYRFAVAEWLWIWFGHADVKTIAPFNPYIAEFSDDGQVFAGAYGPMIRPHWDYVLRTMRRDRPTRQAVIQVFAEPQNPSTKDVPCTLSLQFQERYGFLHTTVNMRSSDAWLGLPYDIFTFSRLGAILAGQLEARVGSITMNLGSSHLYVSDKEKVYTVLREASRRSIVSPDLPGAPPPELDEVLCNRRAVLEGAVWQTYARVLQAGTNREARAILEQR